MICIQLLLNVTRSQQRIFEQTKKKLLSHEKLYCKNLLNCGHNLHLKIDQDPKKDNRSRDRNDSIQIFPPPLL